MWYPDVTGAHYRIPVPVAAAHTAHLPCPRLARSVVERVPRGDDARAVCGRRHYAARLAASRPSAVSHTSVVTTASSFPRLPRTWRLAWHIALESTMSLGTSGCRGLPRSTIRLSMPACVGAPTPVHPNRRVDSIPSASLRGSGPPAHCQHGARCDRLARDTGLRAFCPLRNSRHDNSDSAHHRVSLPGQCSPLHRRLTSSLRAPETRRRCQRPHNLGAACQSKRRYTAAPDGPASQQQAHPIGITRSGIKAVDRPNQ